LSKLRTDVGDDAGLMHWVGIMRKWVRLDVPAEQIPNLAALARRVQPERMTNVVLPGRVGYAGKASVVYLTQDAPRLFEDLRDDAVIGTAAPATTTPTSAASSTTTEPRASATTTTTTTELLPLPGG
jgi:hypothetical protein